MKRACFAVVIALMLAGFAGSQESVRDTAHNLSATGPSTVKAVSVGWT